jgi:hypothetical protein
VLDAIGGHSKLGRISQRIVDAQLLDEPTVTGAPAVGGDDTVKRDFFAAGARKTNGHGHFGLPSKNEFARLTAAVVPVKVIRGQRAATPAR